MKRIVKTYEEFIGDETTDNLRKKAAELQQKDGDKVYDEPAGGISDDSGDEMGSDVG